MLKTVIIPRTLWDEIISTINSRLNQGILCKPIVFALYTIENNYSEIIDYKEIPTVEVTSDYPNGDYTYKYPGIKKLGFYPPKGTGRWFSGTLVVGDGLDLDDEDKKWMIKDEMNFRIKMDKDNSGIITWKAYYLDTIEVQLDFS